MNYKDYRFWVNNSLTKLRHCLSLHFCLILFGPPNFFISCQNKKICIKQSNGGKLFQHEYFICMHNTFEINMCILLWYHTCSNKLMFITNSFKLHVYCPIIWIFDSKILWIVNFLGSCGDKILWIFFNI